METKESKEIVMQGVKKGMDGLFTMDRNIEKPTLTAEEKEREKLRAAYEKKRNNKE